MLYNQQDIKILKDEIEFVDTAIIPLTKVDMDTRALDHASNQELLQLIVMQIEKQFKGRLFITPMIATINENTSHVVEYVQQLKNYGFKHILILSHLSTDIHSVEHIKINHIPMGDLSNDIKFELVNEEVKVILKRIISVWNQ